MAGAASGGTSTPVGRRTPVSAARVVARGRLRIDAGPVGSALKRRMERVQVVQDGGRSMADGGDAVTSGGTSAGAGVTLDAGEPRLEVMLTAADPLTGLLLADRLAEHQMVVQEVAFDDMVERSRVGSFDAVIAVPPTSLLDYSEHGWHSALMALDPELALAVIAAPRLPVRALADARRASGGLAILDSSTPASLWALLMSIRFAASGRRTVDPAFVEQTESAVFGGLSPAERAVYDLLAFGYSNKAIAER